MSGEAATFGEAVSSLSFPFEGFDEMFVTKSGMTAADVDASESSTTVFKRIQNDNLRGYGSALTVRPR